MRNVLVGLGLLLALLVIVWAMRTTAPGSSIAATRALSVVGEPLVTRPAGAGTTVFVAGRVKNEAQRPYSGQVTVTLFDDAGKIVGTCVGAVNDVAPGDEVTYQAMGAVPEAATWTKVEPKVTLQIPR